MSPHPDRPRDGIGRPTVTGRGLPALAIRRPLPVLVRDRTDMRVSRQGQDDASVRAPLQKMSGKVVPERMRTDGLANARLTHGVGNGLVDGAGIEMVAACLRDAPVDGPTPGGEDVLPSPVLVGLRVLAGQGVRKTDLPIPLLRILIVGHLTTWEVLFQGPYELPGESRSTVLVSLAAAHREGPCLQVHVPNPDSGALHDAQARAVPSLDDDLMHSGHQVDHVRCLRAGQYDGYPDIPSCTVCADF